MFRQVHLPRYLSNAREICMWPMLRCLALWRRPSLMQAPLAGPTADTSCCAQRRFVLMLRAPSNWSLIDNPDVVDSTVKAIAGALEVPALGVSNACYRLEMSGVSQHQGAVCRRFRSEPPPGKSGCE